MNRRRVLRAPQPQSRPCRPCTRLAPRSACRACGQGHGGLADAGGLGSLAGGQVGGRLVAVRSPLARCIAGADERRLRRSLQVRSKNPYYLGDESALTQTLGWVDAWTSMPSVYAVAARDTADVVAAVNFAREHDLRLVVKGGGHSYQGTSNAADSLLVWTRHDERDHAARRLRRARLRGRARRSAAVSVGAGAIWAQVYDAVTTQGRRLRAGRRLHDGRRRRAGAERRLRQLLEGATARRRQPAGSRSRHRRRRGADRQRLHQPGPVLGTQGRRRRQLRRRHPR